MKKRIVFSTNGGRTHGCAHGYDEPRSLLNAAHKVSSQWVRGPNTKFSKSLGRHNSTARTQKAQTMKWNYSKIDLTQIWSFCSSKNTTDKMDRQTRDWEKIFASQMCDKELLFRTYSELLERNNKKSSLKAWVETKEKISQMFKQLGSVILTKRREKCIQRHSPAD